MEVGGSEHLLAYRIGALEIMLGAMDIPSLKDSFETSLLKSLLLIGFEYNVQQTFFNRFG